MTTAPSIFVIGDYGMLPPTTTTTTSSSSPNAHMNTVSIRKVWGRVGERCKQRERERKKCREKKEKLLGFFCSLCRPVCEKDTAREAVGGGTKEKPEENEESQKKKKKRCAESEPTVDPL